MSVKSIFFKVLYWSPLILISLVAAAIPYIGISSLFQIHFHRAFESAFLYVLLSAAIFTAVTQVVTTIWKESDFSLRPSHALFLISLCLIFYRSAIFFHAIDDFAFHIAGGYFLGRLWSDNLFMAMDISTYLFPMLQTMFYFLIDAVGIRLSLLFLSLLQLLWLVHLNMRFSVLFFPEDKHKRYIVDLFCAFLFFLPELVSTHVTFMSDFYTTLFALEALYVFLKKGNFAWMFFLMVIAAFCKQSSGLFLAPLFLFFTLQRWRTITRKDLLVVAVLLAPIIFFHVLSYLYSGNPTSFLLNSIFHSPLYPPYDFRDRRWGPLTFRESLAWPAYGSLSPKFVEPIAIAKLQFVFGLFTIVPFFATLFFAIKKRSLFLTMLFLSYLFWSFNSGYGRYAVAFGAIAGLICIREVAQRVPRLNNNWKSYGVFASFGLLCFTTIRADYALRGFFLERFFPPKISPYHFQLYKDGIGLFGRDRYSDVYNSVKDNFKDYQLVANGYRGINTYYSMLANKFEGKPIVSALTPELSQQVLSSDALNPLLTENLRQLDQLTPILLIADGGHIDAAYASEIYKRFTCTQMDRPRTAPQFQHDNYFNHIEEFSCR